MNTLYENITKEKALLIESKSEEIAKMIKEGNIDEGFLGALVGGLAGLTAGATIMKAVCKALGLEKGILYDMLTSKIICAAAGAAIGKNI